MGMREGEPVEALDVRVVPLEGDKGSRELQLGEVDLEERALSLSSFGRAINVDGPDRFDPALIQVRVDTGELDSIDPRGARLFRFDGKSFEPVWDSGVVATEGIAWGRLRRPGVYVPIGLPRDRVLQGILGGLARERRLADEDDDGQRRLLEEAFMPLLEQEDVFFEMRQAVMLAEVQTRLGGPPRGMRLGNDGRPLPPPLPKGLDNGGLRERLAGIIERGGGILPEEALFFPPEEWGEPMPPWDLPWGPNPGDLPPDLPPDFPGGFPGRGPRGWEPGDDICPPWLKFPPWPPEYDWWTPIIPRLPWWWWWRWHPLCVLLSRDWWMHQHDHSHSGVASGCSGIRRTTVGGLTLQRTITLDGPIISQPAVVYGKVYVGTAASSTIVSGGTMYRIDLASGAIEATFQISGVGAGQGQTGICCTPAVTGGRVYFSGLNGKIYCLDAGTFAQLWVTDLRRRDLAHNQPVDHGGAASEGWSSPVVANGRVYVGFGEGEQNAYGFVYCLDASNGNVLWLFCTNQFDTAADNAPNVIPPATWTGAGSPPAPFTLAAAAPTRGASPWGSAAYDATLDRVYIGTGNARDPGDTPLPDARYASGIISLDATSGAFRGFFQPAPSDSYRSSDLDVDVPAPPILFTRDGVRYVALGSKNGSFFILDADTMAVVARRQLLPYDVNGNPFPNVDPETFPRENEYGSFCSAAVHRATGRLFVGVGGYSGAIDSTTTPFIRALDWATLADRWPTSGTNPPKYSAASPPLYTTPGESGIASPAIVNDVVFMSTTKTGLYALDIDTGALKWSAAGLPSGQFAWGPAIYGNYVLNGVADGNLYVYHL
ncbi:MAG TPA: PQQ-binding-like beta-propeller repeat protein [Actinomycetota bacterium]|nr:PQQ-binding-like beta-propeller repeat protein [Actinomycetota bacterium]